MRRQSLRYFRLLRRLYPRDLVETHGNDIERLFLETLDQELKRLGRIGYVYVWFSMTREALSYALARNRPAHANRRRRVLSPDRLANDIRLSFRTMRRDPVLTATIICTIALGIGANVAMFSVLYGVLVRPLPFAEPDRLVTIWESNPELGRDYQGPAPGNVIDWEEQSQTFEAITAGFVTSATFRDGDYAEEVAAGQVTESFFDVLRMPLHLGRGFVSDDYAAQRGAAVLGYRLWMRHFGGDSTVLGRSVELSGVPTTVVGVAPREFRFLQWDVDLWTAWDLRIGYARLSAVPRDWRFLTAVGRLRGNVTPAQAEADLDAISAELALQYPESNRGWDTKLTSVHQELVDDARPALLVAFGAVAFILILAIVNVANIQLSRVVARMRDINVRRAVGASGIQVAKERLVESTVLAICGGALGIIVAYALLRVFVALDAGQIPRLEAVGIDPAVLVFASIVMVVTGIATGLVPAWHATAQHAIPLEESNSARAGNSRKATRVRSGLVVAQIALSLALVIGAGLFATSLLAIRSTEAGFDPARILTFRTSLNPPTGGPEQVVAYYEAVTDSLARLPGVLSVGASTTLPLNPVGNDFTRPFRHRGSGIQSADAPVVQMRIVTPELFDALRISFVEGYGFNGREQIDGQRVAVINQTLAARLWPGEPVVDRSFEMDFRGGWHAYRVIGVIRDVKHYGQRNVARPEVFLSASQIPYLAMSLAVRTSGEPAELIPAVRTILRSIDSRQPAHHFVTMDHLLSASVAEERFLVVFLAVFALVALALAASGVYGVMSYSVTQRTREIGVRIALGARAGVMLRSVVVRALALALTGVGIGCVVSLALGRAVRTLLFGITPSDPRILIGGVAVLVSVALASAFIPAWRASRVDPVVALRGD